MQYLQSFFKDLFFNYESLVWRMWGECVYECKWPKGQKGASGPLQLELQIVVSSLVWVLGTDLQFFARVEHAFNHWANSIASHFNLKFYSCIHPTMGNTQRGETQNDNWLRSGWAWIWYFNLGLIREIVQIFVQLHDSTWWLVFIWHVSIFHR